MSARGVIWAVLAFGAALFLRGDDGLTVEEKETIERAFPAAKSIDVDNFDGSITVTGTDAREVRVEIQKTIRAGSAEKIQEAKREVRLDIAQHDDGLRFYVDGPFRCHCSDG
ncbi:MAG TPA: hypothetical protein VFO27_05425, partial [Bryobacteraceae bacterium]|nr:hypothetical protein [Bryobacteraceae bacterium]